MTAETYRQSSRSVGAHRAPLQTTASVIGLWFAAHAGCNPRAAVSFWKKMSAKTGGSEPLKWLSTHPPSSERIVNLERLAPQYLPIYEAYRIRFE